MLSTVGSVARRSEIWMRLDIQQVKPAWSSQTGRVQEIKINVRKLPSSSSARARYLLSPVSLRNFLASRVKIMVERVSFMTAMTKSKRNPVNLQRDRYKSSVVIETMGPDRHHVDPLNPAPLKVRIHFYPTSDNRSETSPANSTKRINWHR